MGQFGPAGAPYQPCPNLYPHRGTALGVLIEPPPPFSSITGWAGVRQIKSCAAARPGQAAGSQRPSVTA